MILYTSHESTLEGLIERPLEEGDLLSNANTLIYLGKIRDGSRFRAPCTWPSTAQRLHRRDHPLPHRRRGLATGPLLVIPPVA